MLQDCFGIAVDQFCQTLLLQQSLKRGLCSGPSQQIKGGKFAPLHAPGKNRTDLSKSSPNGSGAPSTSAFQCAVDSCRESFTLKKDLRRHHQTQHGDGSPYKCKCGRDTRRKDNFRRHIANCDHKPLASTLHCCCGRETLDADSMMYHIASCGAQKRGRRAVGKR